MILVYWYYELNSTIFKIWPLSKCNWCCLLSVNSSKDNKCYLLVYPNKYVWFISSLIIAHCYESNIYKYTDFSVEIFMLRIIPDACRDNCYSRLKNKQFLWSHSKFSISYLIKWLFKILETINWSNYTYMGRSNYRPNFNRSIDGWLLAWNYW